ncbi:MAG: MBL fold metallo-hydrolase [Acholeplasmataceae bacterium]|nr:MBL fold metallo-hydrolase [Acholeplasmataceae bacterium]
MMKEGGKLKVYILASGSKGNITYLKVGHIKVFIDAGISYQKMKKKMEAYGESIEDVKALFLTHEHHDHTMGLLMLLKKGNLKDLFMTQGTYESLSEEIKQLIPNLHIIKADYPFTYETLNMTPFMISHDAKEPVGYVISNQNKKIVHITDTGYIDQNYHDLLQDADLYILESNHNPAKLMASPRPFLLKKRILSEKGHLSNEDACWLMNRFVKKHAIWIVSHISEDCNSILDIEESIIKIFDDPTKIDIYYASQEGLPVIEL